MHIFFFGCLIKQENKCVWHLCHSNILSADKTFSTFNVAFISYTQQGITWSGEWWGARIKSMKIISAHLQDGNFILCLWRAYTTRNSLFHQLKMISQSKIQAEITSTENFKSGKDVWHGQWQRLEIFCQSYVRLYVELWWHF